MKRIELPQGITYRQAKVNAGALITHDDSIESVRIIVQKETNRMWIEYTEFPQKTVDRLTQM